MMGRALEEAIRLGHRSAGLPHVLLALLDERCPSTAQDVLRSLGVERHTVETEGARRYGCVPREPEGQRSATSDLLWHETAGRAQGFAAAQGGSRVRPEHVLLALLWQPQNRWFEDVLTAAGTSRAAVAAGLSARGVRVPLVEVPELPPPMTQVAQFPKALLQELNWALRARVPSLHWGIGSDKDDESRMIALAAAEVDLETVLDDVVGPGRWRWRTGTAPS